MVGVASDSMSPSLKRASEAEQALASMKKLKRMSTEDVEELALRSSHGPVNGFMSQVERADSDSESETEQLELLIMQIPVEEGFDASPKVTSPKITTQIPVEEGFFRLRVEEAEEDE